MFNRIIPHIGQGCCVEQKMFFGDKSMRILYDCGSNQKNLLKGYIDLMDTSIPTVLVVSHLHDDHINGIPYLVDRFKKGKIGYIEKLILPNLRKNENILKIFAASIISSETDAGNGDDDINRLIDFIFQPNEGQNFGEIIYVDAEEEDKNALLGSDVISHRETKNVFTIHDGIYSHDIFWTVKFWVDRDIYQNLTPLEESKISTFDMDDFKDHQKRNSKTKKMKKLYADLLRRKGNSIDLNKTSMMMADFFSDSKGKPIICLSANANIGFVCTGDYPIDIIEKRNDIADHYLQMQCLLHEMMAPHHGADDCCKYMPFDFIRCAYAQNSKTNTYGHPGQQTIKKLEDWGIEFINIQENIQMN